MSLELKTTYFEDLAIGMCETYSRTVTDADIRGFAAVSGDNNPIHLSDAFASGTPFKSRIAHGIYTASLISAVIGMRLPGSGTIYLSQTLSFLAPVRIGDTVEARVEIQELIAKGRRAKLACTCKVGDAVVLSGEAIVKAPARAG